jgi:hypothetical protein
MTGTGARNGDRLKAVLSWIPFVAAFVVLITPVLIGQPLPHTLVPIWGVGWIAFILWGCFGSLARTDRTAFASFALPAMVLVLAGFIVPTRMALDLLLVATAFLTFVEFGPGRFYWWWWRVILRRPSQAFGFALAEQRRRLDRASNTLIRHKIRDREKGLREFDRAVAGLLALRPPDDEWTAIRDRYVGLDRRWRSLLQLDGPPESYAPVYAEFVELRARFQERLRARS